MNEIGLLFPTCNNTLSFYTIICRQEKTRAKTRPPGSRRGAPRWLPERATREGRDGRTPPLSRARLRPRARLAAPAAAHVRLPARVPRRDLRDALRRLAARRRGRGGVRARGVPHPRG